LINVSGTGISNPGLRYGDPSEIAEAAAELEDLGYTSLWVPDVGGDVFEAVERLLRATEAITIATGVVNLWMHSSEETATAHAQLTAAYGDRFLLGLGVGHAFRVNRIEPGLYRNPLGATERYLDDLDHASVPVGPDYRMLAALGPKMLDLARHRTAGAHTFHVTPEHTALARQALGPSKLLVPGQVVAFTKDPEIGRARGRAFLAHYLRLPNYTNNLRRLGFDDDDFSDGGSDRLIDGLIAWGGEEEIAARVDAHGDAGADGVCVWVLGEDATSLDLLRPEWRDLAGALTSGRGAQRGAKLTSE
jgi:probable F420-dependent oxidoreductase